MKRFVEKKRRLISILTSLALVLSIMPGTTYSVNAAEISLINQTIAGSKTVSEGQADVSLAAYMNAYATTDALQQAGVTRATVTLKVNNYQADGYPGVMLYAQGGNGGNWENQWENLSSNTISVSLDLSSWSGDGIMNGFGLRFANLSNGSNISYEIYSLKLTTNGGGSSGGSSGAAGNIDANKEYNFAKALQYSLYFYDANMCGTKPSYSLCDWRGNCHVGDTFVYNGKTYNADGGYHDAGDHVKFGLPMAYSMSVLGLGYYEFGSVYDELGQTGHLKNIINYGLDYFKKCTVWSANGSSVEAFCYQIAQGDADHGMWTTPESQSARNASNNNQYYLVASSSNPATDIMSETAAAFAINYLNFGKAEDYKYAKAFFEFARNNSKQIGAKDGSFYGSSSWEDDYAFAASMMYEAAKKAKIAGIDSTVDTNVYVTEYNSKISVNSVGCYDGLQWDNVSALAALYKPAEANASKLNTVTSYLSSNATDLSSYYCKSEWGSARANTGLQLIAAIYQKHTSTSNYNNWMTYQMSTILGNNSRNLSLLIGYGNNYPKNPHHRAASNGDMKDNADGEHVLLGALVGGPKTKNFSSYNDTISDYVTNEVACDYNASLPGACAWLYLIHKNDTAAGFNNQSVDSSYYVDKGVTIPGSNVEPTTAATTATTKATTTAATTKATTAATTKATTTAATTKATTTVATTKATTTATTTKATTTAATTKATTTAATTKATTTAATTAATTKATTAATTKATTTAATTKATTAATTKATTTAATTTAATTKATTTAATTTAATTTKATTTAATTKATTKATTAATEPTTAPAGEVAANEEVIDKSEGTWVETSNGKSYKTADGKTPRKQWLLINNNWYYFNADGVIATGWIKDAGHWYFLNSDGTMATGWVKDGGKWYFLNADGSMATGWAKDGGKWYFLNADGSMATGWIYDGAWYYLNSSGAMAIGWIIDNGDWYYMDNSGAMQTGWVYYKGDWYYMHDSGDMAYDEHIGNYYINEDGIWVE